MENKQFRRWVSFAGLVIALGCIVLLAYSSIVASKEPESRSLVDHEKFKAECQLKEGKRRSGCIVLMVDRRNYSVYYDTTDDTVHLQKGNEPERTLSFNQFLHRAIDVIYPSDRE